MRFTDAIPAICTVVILAGCFVYYLNKQPKTDPSNALQATIALKKSAEAQKQEIARLKTASAGLRELVGSLDRAKDPAAWADAQHLLARTLFSLGVQTNTRKLIEEAAAANKAALEFYTEEQRRNPQEKSRFSRKEILLQQGSVLSVLAQQKESPAHFEEALNAYRQAGKLYAEDREPVPLAQTYEGAGNTLVSLSRFDGNPAARLREAELSYRAAAETYPASDNASRRRCQDQYRAVQELLGRYGSGSL